MRWDQSRTDDEPGPFHAHSSPRNGLSFVGLHGLICVALIAATLAALGPSLDNGWVNWDDPVNFIENEHIRGLDARTLRWIWTTGHMGLYQPLSWMTVALDYEISGGLDPRGLHRTSLILHGANAVLFYALAVVLLNRGGGLETRTRVAAAAIAALLFAVHPLRVESVAWATERRDVVSGLFFLLALLAYVRSVSGARGYSRSWMIASVLLHACAVLSKVICVTLPAVLLVLDVYPLRRLGGRGRRWGGQYTRVWAEKIPFAVISLGASVVGVLAMGVGLEPLGAVGMPERLANSALALVFYPFKFFWPVDLLPIYHLHRHVSLSGGFYLACALVVVVVSLAAIVLRRRFPAGLAVWVSYFVMISPVLSFTQNGFQFAADRYTYLALLGFCLLVGGVMAWCVGRAFKGTLRSPALILAVLAIAVVLVPLARRQTRLWRDSVTLWEATLRVNPSSHTAHQNLGKALMELGQVDRAAEEFRLALQHYHAGRGLTLEGADELARRAAISGGDAAAILNAGEVMIERGDWAGAVEILRIGVQQHPEHAEIRFKLGMALAKQQDHAAAYEEFKGAAALDPANAEITRHAVESLIALGRYGEAAGLSLVLSHLLSTAPTSEHRDGAAAVRWAEWALQRTPDPSPQVLGILANAYAEAGRFGEARASCERAIDKALVLGRTRVAQGLRERLELYRSGRAFHASPPPDGSPATDREQLP